MNDVLADTHAVVWFLFARVRLSPPALAVLNAAAQSGTVYISAITLVEVNYLIGKKSFPYPGVFPQLLALAADPNEALEVLPVTADVARAMDRVPRAEVPDMPDRIIAATAVTHGLPLVSADSDIRGSAGLNAIVTVIW
jgi:PIN domain nuclease of toxin-antitoxin system